MTYNYLLKVASDGDCLYAAVSHQLGLLDGPSAAPGVVALRRAAASTISARRDDYLPFLTSPATGDLMSEGEFAAYLREVSDTNAWGGQLELKALSEHLGRPLEVVQAEGPPMVVGEGEGKGPNLVIAYYRHMYGLGEHYNSTKPGDE